jgi:hypothetical protein
MISPKSEKHGSTLASLAELYPRAFTMAAASHSRSGLALRLAGKAASNSHLIYSDERQPSKLVSAIAILKLS